MAEEKEWFTRKEAARYLNSIGCPISPNTLAFYAANNNQGGGPPFVRFRWNRVSYKRTELTLWASKETTRIA